MEADQVDKVKRPVDGHPEDGVGSPRRAIYVLRYRKTSYRTEDDESRRRDSPVLRKVVVRRLRTCGSLLRSFLLGGRLKKRFRRSF